MESRLVRVLALCAAGVLMAVVNLAVPARGQIAPHSRQASPALDYVHLFGGTLTEQGAVLALGSRSNIFLAGTTTSPDWPVPWKSECVQAPCSHAFLLKLQPDATAAFYRVVLGGSRSTQVSAVAVDGSGNAYLTGTTTSPDFPTVHPFQAHCGDSTVATCNDGFIARFNPKGTLTYSTFLGGHGADSPTSIALDRYGDISVAGQTNSPDFPTSHAAQPHLRGGTNGFVARLDATGRHLLYSTYLGGTKDESIAGMVVDRLGEVYVTGATYSPDFRTSSHALQPHFIGGDCAFYRCGDAFVVKLGTAGRFLAGSFLATPADERGNAIVLDGAGNVYVAGYTGNARIPSATAVAPTGKTLCGSEGDVLPCESAFVVALTPDLSRLRYSRILAGDGLDSANAVAVNALGNVVVAGYTESTNFPTVNPVQSASGGGECSEAKGGSVPCDGFVAIIAPHNRSIRFSTYLGGNGSDHITSLALDGHGNAYLAGTTYSSNFPQGSTHSLPKAFLARIEQLYR